MTRPLKQEAPCECADAKCPEHEGQSACVNAATCIMRRIDMDNARVRFCDPCAEDAGSSGVFA